MKRSKIKMLVALALCCLGGLYFFYLAPLSAEIRDAREAHTAMDKQMLEIRVSTHYSILYNEFVMPLGIFTPSSFEGYFTEYSGALTHGIMKAGARIIVSADLNGPGRIYGGFYDWRAPYAPPHFAHHMEKMIIQLITPKAYCGNALGTPYTAGDKSIMSNCGFKHWYPMPGWRYVKTKWGLRPRPVQDEERARSALSSIPRAQDSVHVRVATPNIQAEGQGSSVRNAVQNALNGTGVGPKEARLLEVRTFKGYRLHEVNAAVFSDDFAFIRTKLCGLERLDLSHAQFYRDTVPVSAMDCSRNVEFAYNLPKGDLPHLATLMLPPSIRSVDAYAFRGLSSLREIRLPRARYIQRQAFEGCVRLQEIHLPEVRTVAHGAFFGCKSLDRVSLPNVKNISSLAFLETGWTPPLKSLDVMGFDTLKPVEEAESPPNEGKKEITESCNGDKRFARFKKEPSLPSSGTIIFAQGEGPDMDITPIQTNNDIAPRSGERYVNGTSGNDMIFSSTEDIILRGNGGSDIYYYRMGDGNNTVIHRKQAGCRSALRLHTDITSLDVRVSRKGADLRLDIGNGSVTLKNWYRDINAQIDRVEIYDGTIWDGLDLETLAQGPPPSNAGWL